MSLLSAVVLPILCQCMKEKKSFPPQTSDTAGQKSGVPTRIPKEELWVAARVCRFNANVRQSAPRAAEKLRILY